MNGSTRNTIDALTDLQWSSRWECFCWDVRFESAGGGVFEKDGFRVPAGTRGAWRITVGNTGPDLMAPLSFHLCSVNVSLAHRFQQEHGARRDYARLGHDGTNRWRLVTDVPGFHNVVHIDLEDGVFRRGDTVTVTLGDMSGGGAGSEIYWTTTRGFLVLEAEAGGELRPVGDRPFSFDVIHRDEVGLVRLLLPTTVCPGESFHAVLTAFDSFGNVHEGYSDTVRLRTEASVAGLPGEVAFTPGDRGSLTIRDLRFSEEGVHRVELECGWGRALSNPCVVKKDPGRRIYWGDLHVHGWGDSTMHLMHVNTQKINPRSRHLQARDIGRFDYCAIGPMSFPQVNRGQIWDAYRSAVRELEQPGRYIPFLSYEAHPEGEDRTVIFRDEAEVLPPSMSAPMVSLMETMYGREDVLMECHMGGGTPKWEKHRPGREDLVEVASAFGNGEWLLRHGLAMGYRPAVCGCSDLHMGLAGGPRTVEPARGRFAGYLNQRDSAYGSGPLTAVACRHLTRHDLFDAMKQRHTYATNGERIYLSASMNGVPMGGEVEPSPRYRFEIECAGTAPIRRVTLICGEYELMAWRPRSLDFHGVWSADGLYAPFVYLRVEQDHDGFAWSSPFYVNGGLRRWDASDDDGEAMDPAQAAPYLRAVVDYLAVEEDPSLFSAPVPVGLLREPTAACALFRCVYAGIHEMTIKWYYEYEIPKIRLDWGTGRFGVRDDEALYPR